MPVRKVKTSKGEALAADMPGGYTKVVQKDGTHVILAPKKTLTLPVKKPN